MKNIKFLSILCIMAVSLSFLSVNAYNEKLEDHRVIYNYWSQGNHSKMFWTGVVNKVNYDEYKPCVGPYGSEYTCGTAAKCGEYQEYGWWINNQRWSNKICHGLETSYGSGLQYFVTAQASADDY